MQSVYPPKRRLCWKVKPTFQNAVPGPGITGSTFQAREYSIWSFYAPQTKILEGGTKDEMRIFEGSTFQWTMAHVANKNCAISHPRLNEGKCIREYSTIRLLSNIH